MILKAQMLPGIAPVPPGKGATLATISRLGYVQIDTISVVERSHHHVLWTRQVGYHPNDISVLINEDRSLFEYWAHAMAYLPMQDYRFYLPKMKKFHNPSTSWAKHQLGKCKHLMPKVLERIRNEGPLASKDFKAQSHKKGTWWDWKPAKIALEFLFWRGDLMITDRRGFQKIYDLTERVLPPGVDTSMPARSEIGEFIVRRGLAAMGLADETDLSRFLQPAASRDSDWRMVDTKTVHKTIQSLVDAGVVVELICAQDNHPYYALSETLKKTNGRASSRKEVYILSPFDNCLIMRDRLQKHFDFSYSLECYLPASKRTYGYFNMPILYGDEFVGQLDPKADRKEKRLILQNIFFKTGYSDFESVLSPLAVLLVRMAAFNGCNQIEIKNTRPKKIAKALERIIASL